MGGVPQHTATNSRAEVAADGGTSPGLPRWMELGSAAIYALVGVIFLAAGGALLTVTDRAMLTDLVERDVLRSDALADETLVEVVHTLTFWGGWGLLLTGVITVLGGIWFGVYTRGDGGQLPDGRPTRRTSAIVGGAAGIILSFVPFAPALGGGVAGYFGPRGSGLATGTGAGLLAVLPGLIPGVFLAVGFVLQPPLPDPVPSSAILGVLVVVGLLLGAVFGIVAGGIGGYAGEQIADSG